MKTKQTHPSVETRIKQGILRSLTRRFFLRFHVAILLLWAFCVGLLTARLMLALGADSMLVRYPVAVLAAYCAFLIGVRVWLAYVDLGRHIRRRGESDATLDLPNIDLPSAKSEGIGAIHAGGGRFGGGGANGNYAIDHTFMPDAAASEAMAAGLSETGGGLSGLGEWGGAAASEGCLPALAIAFVLAILAGFFSLGAYLVAEAPMVLVEAAFEALLAGGLLRVAKRVDEADWLGAVVRVTWPPLAMALLLSILFSMAAMHYRPDARTIAQVFWTN